MPRLAVDDTEKKFKEISKIIQHYMIEREVKDDYVAVKLRMHVRTFRRKKNNPEQFKYDEMVKLCALLQVKNADKERLL